MLAFLLGTLVWAGPLDLPEGRWSNGQRPGFEVTVGDAKEKRMTWDIDGLVLKGTYRVTAAAGSQQVLFHIDSMTGDGEPVTSSAILNTPLKRGGEVRSVWVRTRKGINLTIQGEGGKPLTVVLSKSVPSR